MNTLHLPLLELGILIPLGGAIAAHRQPSDRARRIAMVAAVATLFVTIAAWFDLVVVRSFEAHDRYTLLQFLPGGDPLVIDELSAPLLPLAALQYLLTFVSTLRTKATRYSFALALVGEALLLTTFSTRSTWLIVAALVASTIPPTLEIYRRGFSVRLFAGHMVLFAALLIGGATVWSLYPEGSNLHRCGLAAMAVAILIRSGAVPFHLWVGDLFAKASFGTSILYIVPMAGPYAALRMLLPTAPPATLRIVAFAALATALYSAGMSLVQRDARRYYAFVLLSHASLVLLGLELNDLIGLTGALCVWLSVGLAMMGFGLTLRCVESRLGRMTLDRYHGLSEAAPMLGGLFLLTGLASIGFPGTIGFIAVEMLVDAAIHVAPLIGAVLVIASAVNGLAVMQLYFRLFTGCQRQGTIDLNIRPAERVAVVLLALLIVGGGIFPQLGISSRSHAAEAVLKQRARTYPAVTRSSPAQMSTR